MKVTSEDVRPRDFREGIAVIAVAIVLGYVRLYATRAVLRIVRH